MKQKPNKITIPKLTDAKEYRAAKQRLAELQAQEKETEQAVSNLSDEITRKGLGLATDECADQLIAGGDLDSITPERQLQDASKDARLKLEVIRRAIQRQKQNIRTTGNRVSPALVKPLEQEYNKRLRRLALAVLELATAESGTAEILDELEREGVSHSLKRVHFLSKVRWNGDIFDGLLCKRIVEFLECGALSLKEVRGLTTNSNVEAVWRAAAERAPKKVNR